ncbi:MAG: enoyl-CoA hydratase/isomerase family protein, partial [Acidimicrobiaceae bacterium]|nr:enoyl-CoA hydratase/isomerase family protein [Acidimicrobiaceae bacterium]
MEPRETPKTSAKSGRMGAVTEKPRVPMAPTAMAMDRSSEGLEAVPKGLLRLAGGLTAGSYMIYVHPRRAMLLRRLCCRFPRPRSDGGSSETMPYQEIVFEIRNDAAWIGINRPEVRNAFREQTLDEIAEALNSTRTDPTIVAAVVYGVGGHFSAGGDFHAMMKLNKANSYMWNDRMQMVAMTCRNLPIPVIAMVEGACVG